VGPACPPPVDPFLPPPRPSSSPAPSAPTSLTSSLVSVERVPSLVRTYTFCGENVYVSSVKRIRLGHETYTFCPGNVYVLPPQPFPAPLRTMVSPSATPTFAVNSEAVLLALCLCRRRAFIVPLGRQSINKLGR